MTDELPFVIERVNGHGASFVRLSGRIDDRFQSSALGTFEHPLALELSGVRAITSFGVRSFTEALGALSPRLPAYLLECPPCVVDQINLVQGFIGTAEVLSARAIFSCACGVEEERSVDVLADGARIRAGRPPEPLCRSCGAVMRLVEDDTFRFVVHKGARRIDGRVGAMLSQLGLFSPPALEDRPLSVRKVVDGANVALRLDGSFAESTRLERVAEDEGIVVVLVGGLIVRAEGAESFARLLAALGRSARELVLVGVPPQLAGLLAAGAIAIGPAKIDSLLVPVRCEGCEELALASMKLHEPESTLRCPRCGRPALPAAKVRAIEALRVSGLPSLEARSILERVDGLFSQAAVEARLVQRPRDDGSASIDLPTQIGGYKILRPLSAGGMAEVLLATRTSLGGVEKLVALKRFRRELFQAAPAAISMFLAEAKLAAQLSHPNVVQIFDVGESDGDLFMAMELVDGRDLREVVDLGVPVPPHVGAHLGLEIARALAYLHHARDLHGRTLKIVHRDVSPQNVLVDRSGRVVLIDFGVALAGEGELQKRRRKVAGNLAYMSPEQCYGEPLDGRSDLFSLGVVLWELLTGSPLFRRDDAQATRAALLAGVIPRMPGVPPALDGLVRSLLEPRSSDRPASAEQVARELDALLPDLGGRITPAELGAFVSHALSPRAEVERERRAEAAEAQRAQQARGADVRTTTALRKKPAGSPVFVATIVLLALAGAVACYLGLR